MSRSDTWRAAGAAHSAEQIYRERTGSSRELWERATGVLPQGVSGAAKFFSPYPVFIDRASGAEVWDSNGRQYIDLLMGAGPMLLGHGHPRIQEALVDQIGIMTNPMMPTKLSLELAERIRGHMRYLERIRFTNTGSEATRTALRIARSVTGRTRFAKCEGGFHGSDDAFLVATHSHQMLGSDSRPGAVADYAGLPPSIADEAIILPFNDTEAASSLITEHATELAAVIVEPVAFSSGGGIPASPEFMRALRSATSKSGIVLIFDEVVCAYRMGLAGAPAYLGVTPDLATIGKAVGGGLPIGAVGGRADLMEEALGSESGEHRIFQSGTYTENPLSMRAGLAVLDVLETEPILERADATGELLRRGLRTIFEEHGVDAVVTGVRSVIQVHFGTASVRNRRDLLRSNLGGTADFLLRLVAEGVLWPPIHPAVTSGAHTPEHIEVVLDRVQTALQGMT